MQQRDRSYLWRWNRSRNKQSPVWMRSRSSSSRLLPRTDAAHHSRNKQWTEAVRQNKDQQEQRERERDRIMERVTQYEMHSLEIPFERSNCYYWSPSLSSLSPIGHQSIHLSSVQSTLCIHCRLKCNSRNGETHRVRYNGQND